MAEAKNLFKIWDSYFVDLPRNDVLSPNAKDLHEFLYSEQSFSISLPRSCLNALTSKYTLPYIKEAMIWFSSRREIANFSSVTTSNLSTTANNRIVFVTKSNQIQKMSKQREIYSCPICHKNAVKDTNWFSLYCSCKGMQYHKNCISKWLSKNISFLSKLQNKCNLYSSSFYCCCYCYFGKKS